MPRLPCPPVLIAALALASGCARTAPLRAGPATAADASPGVVARPGRAAMPALPNPTVVTHRGETVRFYDDLVRGKIVVVSFTYTQCDGSCPRTGANLVRVQQLLGDRAGKDVFMLSITLDAERDTPEALRRHAEALGAGPGWTFVTGKKEDLEQLRRALRFTDPDPRVDADRTQHAAVVKLGDDRTGRWTAVPGLIAPEQIVDALHRTAREPHATYFR
jgi:protein SCO1/2